MSLVSLIVKAILFFPELAKLVQQIRSEMDKQARDRAFSGNRRDIDEWLLHDDQRQFGPRISSEGKDDGVQP